MEIIIKDMTENEIEGKAFVHWKSWQESYKGIVDDNYLKEKVTLEACKEMAYKWPDNLIVAMDGSKTVGFCGYGKSENSDLKDCGEIFALYVLKEYQNQKVGYTLMQEALRRLEKFPNIAVWVLTGNEKAINFYKRVGFAFDGVTQKIVLGTPNSEERMILHR